MTENKNKELLLIFVKNPVKGKVKTRLAATIGDDKALEIYLFLTKHTRDLAAPIHADIKVAYSGEIGENDVWSTPRFIKDVQFQGGLGERMEKAFETAFQSGYERVAIIGSDCYALTTDILNDAFKGLQTNDVTIGPALDGGYYLLGMNALHAPLFRNKAWSTENVFPETMKDVKNLGLKCALLPALSDIDNEDDLSKTDINIHL